MSKGDGNAQGRYLPITIAEMRNYTKEADVYFEPIEQEKLITFLALHPEGGDVLPGTGGVRLLHWPIDIPPGKSKRARIVYYFRDLNMPLYLLALYRPGEHIPMDSEAKRKIEALVNELVAEHGARLQHVVRLQRGGVGGTEIA
jgi:hypothetical protein